MKYLYTNIHLCFIKYAVLIYDGLRRKSFQMKPITKSKTDENYEQYKKWYENEKPTEKNSKEKSDKLDR